MALTTNVTSASVNSSDNNNLWVTVPKNSAIKIVPLCDFMDTDNSITQYKQFEFGNSKQFWTLPDTQELDDPCRVLGFVSKDKWILPVLLYDDETKTWSQPMYYRIGQSILDGMKAADATIKGVAIEEGEPNLMFKHSVLIVNRDDTAKNGIPKYTVNWTSQHLSKSKEYKSGKIPLPENNLNMIKGFLPFQVDNLDNMQEIHSKMIARLIEKGEFEVEVNGVKTTIADLMKEKGLLSDEFAEVTF